MFLAAAAVAAGCVRAPKPQAPVVEFLTRDGCAMSPRLRANLDAALQTLAPPVTYRVIDESTLGATDPRAAYPTPTILVDERDLFGLPAPVPPFPEPTWRLYKGGVPTPDAIRAKLKAATE